jgi:hypothetical protein
MPTAEKPALRELYWRRPDQYHSVTTDGRYSVCRMNVGPRIHYVAFRRGHAERAAKHIAAVELDAIVVPAKASDAERLAAIKTLQLKCAADVG